LTKCIADMILKAEVPVVDDEGEIVLYKKEVVAPEQGIHVSLISPRGTLSSSILHLLNMASHFNGLAKSSHNPMAFSPSPSKFAKRFTT
jgi:hypothetical protein